MNKPSLENKALRNITDIKEIAFHNIFEKYIISDLRGSEKTTEIESTDQESILKKFNGGFPLPGLIYTFIYKLGEIIAISDGKKPIEYSDKVPLIFCVDSDKRAKLIKGLNLNMLPTEERLKFFDAFYDTYREFFKDLERLTQNDVIALNKEYITIAASGKGQELIKDFSKRMNSNFAFAFRTYKIDKISRFRMIEYQEWQYIPFYSPKDAFTKINQAQMHKLYYKLKQ